MDMWDVLTAPAKTPEGWIRRRAVQVERTRPSGQEMLDELGGWDD